MDTVLLTLDSTGSIRVPGESPSIKVRNLGSSGEHTITVTVPDLGFSGSVTLTLGRSEEAVVTVPLDIGGFDRPRSAVLEVSSSGKMPSKVSRMITFLPGGWYDRTSPDFVSQIAEGSVRGDMPVTGTSLGSDTLESYRSFEDTEILRDEPGMYVNITDPASIKGFGDGTAVDIAVAYASEMLSMGYRVLLVIRDGRGFVGVTDADSDPGSMDGYLVVEPSAACEGIPMSVSKDMSRNFLDLYRGILREGKDYAFLSAADHE